MKALNIDKLNPGDIILTTTSARVSGCIRFFTSSDISHAMIYSNTYSVIESTGDGVHSNNTQRLALEDIHPVYVLRSIEVLTDDQKMGIVSFAREKIGTQYSVPEAVVSAMCKLRRKSRKYFCSRLIAEAYESVGASVVRNASYCTPSDLLKSRKLFQVSDCVRSISNKEWAAIKEIPNLVDVMRNVTNDVLSRVRRLSSSVQDLNDVFCFLIKNPQQDAAIAKFFIESGYFSVMDLNAKTNAWQYQLKLMSDVSNIMQVRKYCMDCVNNNPTHIKRFKNNRDILLDLHNRYHLKTLELNLSLQNILIADYELRMNIASNWLAINP